MLVGIAVKEVHLRESSVHFLENGRHLGRVRVVGHNVEDGAQLLSFLLKAKLLVHVSDSLLEASLESRSLIAQFLFLIRSGFLLLIDMLELIDAFGCLVAVVVKSLDPAATLRTSGHFHALVHLHRGLSQNRHVFGSVVT